MPSSRATARSDSSATPSRSSCWRAASLMSWVSWARARALAVAGADGVMARVSHGDESTARKSEQCSQRLDADGAHTDLKREQCSPQQEDPP